MESIIVSQPFGDVAYAEKILTTESLFIGVCQIGIYCSVSRVTTSSYYFKNQNPFSNIQPSTYMQCISYTTRSFQTYFKTAAACMQHTYCIVAIAKS